MSPFTRHTGRAVLLPLDNVDTDQIIPARFLRKPRSAGYGNFLLHDLRHDETGTPRDGFPLNAPGEPPSVLIAGENFGCGSSREGAVYALVDYGIRAVISTQVADIFRNNAVRNGLAPIELAQEDIEVLAEELRADSAAPVTVDLEAGMVRLKDRSLPFTLDDSSRSRLLLGLDDIAETSQRLERIEAFERDYRSGRGWTLPG